MLEEVAGSLRSVLRRSDILGRYGGDEFMLVMSHDPGRASMVAARAENAVEQGTGLDLSAGISRRPADGATSEQLLAAADARLAHIKSGKRALHLVAY